MFNISGLYIEMLDNEDFAEYAATLTKYKADITNQLAEYKDAPKEVADSYKDVILDKLWRLSKIVGEHYLKCLAAIAEAETVTNTTGTATRHQIEEMEALLEATNPSDTPSVGSESEPLPQHH